MEYSVFDTIGPNMIGPSSSHTAGALVIAKIASKLLKEPLKKVVFTLYGSFAKTYKGHGTDKALVGGMLGFDTEDPRIRESFAIAKSQGIDFSFETDNNNHDFHPNTVKIDATDVKGTEITLIGESIGGGSVLIKNINGVDISLSGEYVTVIVKHQDTAGVLAHVTGVMCRYNVNIAFAKCYRKEKGKLAYTIVELDEHVPNAALEELENQENVYSATLIEI